MEETNRTQILSAEAEAAAEVAAKLSTDIHTGLTDESAAGRLLEYGENRLEEGKKRHIFIRFLMQFTDIMILLLIAAAIVSLVFTFVEWQNEGAKGLIEPLVIFLIIIVNAIIGMVQEGKAERALEALKSISAPLARVVRGGKAMQIPAAQVVPGDIIVLEAGDFVPADARLIVSSSLKCEESALTGESVAAEKNADATVHAGAPLGDRATMVFAGTAVTYGTAHAVVTGTGMQTEMGHIATLLKGATQSKTPLQQKLASLGKYLTIIALAACAAVFVIGMIQFGVGITETTDLREHIIHLVMVSISLAVSAIPEALPAVVTVVLAIGVQRMAAKHAIIKKLPAVETLGSASVICSDKTGTLTQNRMTLVAAYADGEAQEEAITDKCSDGIRKILIYGTLCANGSVEADEDGADKSIGDPTETAIIAAARRNGLNQDALRAEMPRLYEFPFDSDRKLMTTIHRIDGKTVVITKGAVDELLSRCVKGDKKSAKRFTEALSAEALRVIGVAYREINELPAADAQPQDVERDLIFMGLVGMIDPPREEARVAVGECIMAGIKPVMITGDHIITAKAIAAQLGIYNAGDEAVSGVELEQMSDEELSARIRGISVYARVTPSDKIRIVRAWQAAGEVVAMTGDGVNDAPALKAADIGCAMGITGTDVAKGAAAMTLTDDNFATIVDAVKEGRGVYDNIKKVVGFLLGTNIGEIVMVLVSMIIFHVSPLISIQLLWINLVTDSLPAIMLGMEPIERDIMQRKPRKRGEGLFAHGYGAQIILVGVLFGGISIAAYAIGHATYAGHDAETRHAAASTMAFIVLAFSQIVQAFNMRSTHSLFASNPFGNRMLNLAAIASVLLIAVVVFIPPLADAFGMLPIVPTETHPEPLRVSYYFIALALALSPIPVMEAAKAVVARIKKRNGHTV